MTAAAPNPDIGMTSSVAIPVEQIRQALEFNAEFFFHFFLGDMLTRDVPDFHKTVFTEMTHADVERLVIAIPRGHAKTMMNKLCAAWYLLFSEYRFVLYISGSHDLVIPYVNDIASFFDTPNFVSVFGPVEWIKRQDGIGVYKFKLTYSGKICIIRGLGTGQRVRGINVDNERPQLAFVDDAEDDSHVETADAHKKTLRWWFGPFAKCLNPFKNKIIMSGNLISTQSLLYKFLHSPAWRSYLYGALRENGQPLWPEMWPIEKLREDYREYQEAGMGARWFAEMLNHPVAEGGGIIEAEQITYLPQRTPGEIEYGFVVIDPAISSQAWADRAALTIHGWVDDETIWQVLGQENWHGIDLTSLYFKAVHYATHWGFHVIGVESGAMQGAVLHLFEHLRMLNNHHRIKIVPLKTHNRAKHERITAFASQLKKTDEIQPTYALTLGDFEITNQLLRYEPMRKENDDDIIDCAAYGPQMAREYLNEIMQRLPGRPTQRTASLYDIAEC